MIQNLKVKSLFKAVVRQWAQFCQNTSLHGWKYVVLQHTSKFERLIWLSICSISLSVAIYLLISAWMSYKSSPTITLTESTQFEIYKYLFPAVTLCSFNKISKSAAYDMARQLSGNSSNIDPLAQSFKLLYHLVNYNNQNIPQNEYEKLHELLKAQGKTEEEVFEAISPSCHKLIKRCSWKGESRRCEVIFEKIKTPIGYCCVFNYFGSKNKTRKGKTSKHPKRTSSCGYQSALEVLIDNDPSDYFATHIPSIGYRVLMHDPYDFPDWSIQNILCEINTNHFIGLNPEIITVTDNIRRMSAPVRHCLFPSERKMAILENYSFHNCMIECKMVLVLKYCGCLPFYIYNKDLQGGARICSLLDIRCIFENESNILDFMFNKTFATRRKTELGGKCQCWASCESTTYTPESSKGVLDNSFCTNQFLISSGFNLQNHTVIRVFFNDLLGTRHRRDAVYTWHTLLGFYGGILSLLTGFSFISAVEIIYFIVIRRFTTGTRFKNLTRNKVMKFSAPTPPNKN